MFCVSLEPTSRFCSVPRSPNLCSFNSPLCELARRLFAGDSPLSSPRTSSLSLPPFKLTPHPFHKYLPYREGKCADTRGGVILGVFVLLLLVVGISVTACSSTAVTSRPASEDATFLQYSDPDSRRRTSLKCGKWKRNEAKAHRSICRSTAPRSPVLTRGGICVPPPTVTYLPYRRRRRPGFKSQSRRCRVTVLGKLFTPIVPLFTKQQNW